jgi:alpha-beta hydrolase superfamily lysophospholipase
VIGRSLRTIEPTLPAHTGRETGLAYTVWLPPKDPQAARGGVIVLHGAGSCKENHYDFIRAALALGLGAIAFDQRGHGESDGPMDAGAVEDVVTMAGVLRSALGDQQAPLALRGSSMGGYLAILAAAPVKASAVVAICPASAEGLRRGLERRAFTFDVDVPALGDWLDSNPLEPAVRALQAPLLLLHAEGDEQVPVQHSRELSAIATAPGSRLITVPGGHHRSVQHDEELQAVSLNFIVKVFAGGIHRRG